MATKIPAFFIGNLAVEFSSAADGPIEEARDSQKGFQHAPKARLKTLGATALVGTQPAAQRAMKDSVKDKIQGKAHEVKGAIKEKVGRATGKPDLADEGTAEKIGGKVQKKMGDVEKVFEK